MEEIDAEVRELCGRGDHDGATTRILTQLGPMIYRYISAQVRDDTLAADAFAHFSVDLWRGMAGFAGRSTVKVWAYAIARNAAGQVLRKRKRERNRSAEFSSTLSCKVAEQVRTETQSYLRTEFKERFRQLTERLSAEEHALLVLRVNQRLGWDDIAKIQSNPSDAAALKREAARLRKRFQLVREKLHKMAEAEGLAANGEATKR